MLQHRAQQNAELLVDIASECLCGQRYQPLIGCNDAPESECCCYIDEKQHKHALRFAEICRWHTEYLKLTNLPQKGSPNESVHFGLQAADQN
jgi:hypothetical protein